MMNTLKLVKKHYEYELDGKVQAKLVALTDFVIDEICLGEYFKLEASRPWFGYTCFDQSAAFRDKQIEKLRGLAPANNQFATGRFVIYGCHCGCDYCGIISCKIIRTDDSVIWQDVRFEDDDEEAKHPEFPGNMEQLVFDVNQYDQAILAYQESLSD